MVLTIDIPPGTQRRLQEQAQAAGKDVQQYVTQLLEEAAARRSLDEELAPIRESFAAMNVPEEELIRDITQAQSEYRRELRERREKPA